MPVGNDVVDLQDPGNQPGAIHSGFDRRVFCASELRSLDATPTDSARHVLRWTYWAAKESTFKLVQQRDESISFRPRSFTVTETGPGQVDVTFDGSVYVVTLDITDQRVHAIARSVESDALPLSRVDGSATVPTAADASKLVRAQAARTIGKHLGIAAEEISIEGHKSPMGLDVTIVTTAKTDEEGRELLRLLGMPFRLPESNTNASAA